MSDTELSSDDWSLCLLMLLKCELIHDAVNAGLPFNITKKNFGFPEVFKDKEKLYAILQKLEDNSKVAWLREQR